MAEKILLRHPDLPPEQTVEVNERAARHLARSGWERVETAEDSTPPASVPPAEGQDPASATPRRRRAQHEE